MSHGTLPYRSVYVTGASGFVGTYFVEALVRRLPIGAKVHCNGTDEKGPIDLLDEEGLRRTIGEAEPDLVFHLAAQSSVGQSTGEAAATWRVNVGGTLNLAQIVATEVPEACVAFVSSSEVYGATFNTGIVDECAALAPLSIYARTKRAAEDVLGDTLSPNNRLVVFRPSNHSGPAQDARFVLPAFAQQIADIEAKCRIPRVRVGSLVAERDFLDVRDVVSAYLDTLALPDLERREVFNVASGQVVPIRYLLDRLLAMSTAQVTVEQDPERMRVSEIPRAAVDATRLRSRTGWTPSRTLDQTIGDVLEYYRRSEP
jgi:GDP-4-dehydro-6-deoxy-D-mannose reductase